MSDTVAGSLEAMRRRGALVEAFEQAWADGAAPAIEAHLQGEGAERVALLLELALVDLEARTRRGLAACVEVYLRRWPELAAPEALTELVRREWHLRAGSEPEALRDDFVARFPELAGPIRAMKPPPAAEPPANPSTAVFDTLPPAPEAPGAAAPAGLPWVPGYAMEAELGRGGMGVVYKAVQIRARRPVALKMTLSRPGAAGLAERARFRAEAEAMARLAHPNIVQVYEVGECGGQPYFSMEYCDGGGLDRKLAAGPLPPPEAAALVARLAAAMQAAHSRGVVHRDLKPANVLLTAGAQPKVTDFGLARKLDEPGLTQTGMVMGTPSYMAPEQARGEKSIGPPADVWAIGAVLYECLTGRPPFLAATAFETMHQVNTQEPVAPRLLNARVPRDLETIALKCLEKDPARRYASAQALADDLGRWLGGEPIAARPIGRPARAWKWARRNPAVASLTAALALLLVVGTTVATALALIATAQADRADREAEAARGERDRATDAVREEAKARHEADEQRFLAELNKHSLQLDIASRLIREGELDRVAELLRAAPPRFTSTWEHRHIADYLRRRQAVRTFVGHEARVEAVAVSGDGARLATGSWDKTIRLWDARTGKLERALSGHRTWVNCVAISADGARVLSGSNDSTARLWDARTGQEERVLKHKGWVMAVALSGDGRRAVTASADKTLKVWDAATGEEKHTLAGHTGWVTGVVLSGDGRQVVSVSQDQTVRVWDAETGREVRKLAGEGVQCVALSPDGRRVATAAPDRTLRVYDVASGLPTRLLRGHTNDVASVAFAPDGRRVASGSLDHTLRLWDAVTGDELVTIRGATDTIYGVAFSPDGGHVYAASGKGVKAWRADASQEALSIAAHRQGATRAVFFPDGKRLATAGGDGVVRIWEAATGRELRALTGHTGRVNALAVGRDGRVLSGGEDALVKVWDAETGRERLTFKEHKGAVSDLSLAADGQRVASVALEFWAWVWDVETGRQKRALQGENLLLLRGALSPDGRHVVTGGIDNAARVWEADTSRLVHTLRGTAKYTLHLLAVAYSPDGQSIAVGGHEKLVTIWDARAGAARKVLRGHTHWVTGVAFSPDGKYLVSCGQDKTLRLWDVATGQEKLTLVGHAGEVRGVAFSPDGGRIVSAGADGAVKLWAAPAGR